MGGRIADLAICKTGLVFVAVAQVLEGVGLWWAPVEFGHVAVSGTTFHQAVCRIVQCLQTRSTLIYLAQSAHSFRTNTILHQLAGQHVNSETFRILCSGMKKGGHRAPSGHTSTSGKSP